MYSLDHYHYVNHQDDLLKINSVYIKTNYHYVNHQDDLLKTNSVYTKTELTDEQLGIWWTSQI